MLARLQRELITHHIPDPDVAPAAVELGDEHPVARRGNGGQHADAPGAFEGVEILGEDVRSEEGGQEIDEVLGEFVEEGGGEASEEGRGGVGAEGIAESLLSFCFGGVGG